MEQKFDYNSLPVRITTDENQKPFLKAILGDGLVETIRAFEKLFLKGISRSPIQNKPHIHEWIEKGRKIMPQFGYREFDLMECKTCFSKGVYWKGKVKVFERSEVCINLLHEHDWVFEYWSGLKHDKNGGWHRSEVASCECGKWAVRHYGNVENIILKDAK